MMNYKEMNEREQKAFKNIKYATYEILGGLENTMQDNPEDSREYINAMNTLSDYDTLVNMIYCEATTSYYRPGFIGFGEQYERFLKDLRFCGKDWLIECVKDRLAREGYTA